MTTKIPKTIEPITFKETPTPGLLSWDSGPYCGKVYVSPYWHTQTSWITFLDDPKRELLQKQVIEQARDHLAGEDY